MAERKLVPPKKLAARFEAAADWFSLESRKDDLSRYLKNLNRVERDIAPPLPPLAITSR